MHLCGVYLQACIPLWSPKKLVFANKKISMGNIMYKCVTLFKLILCWSILIQWFCKKGLCRGIYPWMQVWGHICKHKLFKVVYAKNLKISFLVVQNFKLKFSSLWPVAQSLFSFEKCVEVHCLGCWFVFVWIFSVNTTDFFLFLSIVLVAFIQDCNTVFI